MDGKLILRSLSIILLLTFGIFANAFSGGDTCVKYEVEVQLTDGQKVNGFMFAVDMNGKFRFEDISFLGYIKTIYPHDTVVVYKNIRKLLFPVAHKKGDCQFYYEATDEVMNIPRMKVKAIQVLRYMVCDTCGFADEADGYRWNGNYPGVITELTKTEIDLLQTKPVAMFGYNDGPDDTQLTHMFSYSAEYKEDSLKKFKEEFIAETERRLKAREYGDSYYNTWKNELRKKKIIVFITGTVL